MNKDGVSKLEKKLKYIKKSWFYYGLIDKRMLW